MLVADGCFVARWRHAVCGAARSVAP